MMVSEKNLTANDDWHVLRALRWLSDCLNFCSDILKKTQKGHNFLE